MNTLKFEPRGWSKAYIEERNNLLFLLNNFKCEIRHIGATALATGRSNRNVDIMVIAHSLIDLSTIAFTLENHKYRPLEHLSSSEVYSFVGPKKVNGYGVTIRVILFASYAYNRFISFELYLKGNNKRIEKYNDFREALYIKYKKDWKSYYKRKQDYINDIIDQNFKFE